MWCRACRVVKVQFSSQFGSVRSRHRAALELLAFPSVLTSLSGRVDPTVVRVAHVHRAASGLVCSPLARVLERYRWVKIRKSVPLRRHIQENPVVDRDARQRVACAAGLGAAGDFFLPQMTKKAIYLPKMRQLSCELATGRRKIVRKKRLLSVVVVTRRLSRRPPASAMTGCCRVRLLPSS